MNSQWLVLLGIWKTVSNGRLLEYMALILIWKECYCGKSWRGFLVGGSDQVERSGVPHFNPTMHEFYDFISEHELMDIPLIGCKFTWSNNMEHPLGQGLIGF